MEWSEERVRVVLDKEEEWRWKGSDQIGFRDGGQRECSVCWSGDE